MYTSFPPEITQGFQNESQLWMIPWTKMKRIILRYMLCAFETRGMSQSANICFSHSKQHSSMLSCTSRGLMFLHWQKHCYFYMFLTLLGYTADSREFSVQTSRQYSLWNLKLLINTHVSFFFFHKTTQEAQKLYRSPIEGKNITFV